MKITETRNLIFYLDGSVFWDSDASQALAGFVTVETHRIDSFAEILLRVLLVLIKQVYVRNITTMSFCSVSACAIYVITQ